MCEWCASRLLRRFTRSGDGTGCRCKQVRACRSFTQATNLYVWRSHNAPLFTADDCWAKDSFPTLRRSDAWYKEASVPTLTQLGSRACPLSRDRLLRRRDALVAQYFRAVLIIRRCTWILLDDDALCPSGHRRNIQYRHSTGMKSWSPVGGRWRLAQSG